jgi:hypothetical protein
MFGNFQRLLNTCMQLLYASGIDEEAGGKAIDPRSQRIMWAALLEKVMCWLYHVCMQNPKCLPRDEEARTEARFAFSKTIRAWTGQSCRHLLCGHLQLDYHHSKASNT